MERTSWPKRITVDKRIVGLLSRSTYEKFPKAVREVVSNAYDADATIVDLVINLTDRQITIEDNGIGMTPEEFDFYLRIAGQTRGKTESVKFGRKRIGQLGVGFLAVFLSVIPWRLHRLLKIQTLFSLRGYLLENSWKNLHLWKTLARYR